VAAGEIAKMYVQMYVKQVVEVDALLLVIITVFHFVIIPALEVVIMLVQLLAESFVVLDVIHLVKVLVQQIALVHVL